MKSPLFSGACTALVTPFLGGNVNYPMLEQLIRRQLDAGIRAIVVCGTTGEAATLSDMEKLKIIRKAKEYAGSSCLILAGTGSNSTEHTVTLSRAAEKCGADGLLIVSPYYNKATPDGLVTHYSTVAAQVEIPIVLYNVPGRTGVDMPVSVYQALAEYPNIVGVKEAAGSLSKIADILHRCPPEFAVWSGNDDLTVPIISIGGAGVISVLSNICPEKTQDLAQAAIDGDFDTAASLHQQLLPLMRALFREINPMPVKAAMKILGYDCGGCRLPLTQISEALYKELTELLM